MTGIFIVNIVNTESYSKSAYLPPILADTNLPANNFASVMH